MKAKSWKDITLKKAVEIAGIGDGSDSMATIVRQLAIILDMDDREIEEKWDFSEILAEYEKWKFISQLPKPRFDKSFKHKGVRYVMCDLDRLKMAQIVDIEEFYSQGFLPNLHRMMAVLYLPAKKGIGRFIGKFEPEEYEWSEARAEAFLEMDMDFVWGNALFFCNGVQAYIAGLQGFLRQKSLEMMNQAQLMAAEGKE